EMPEEEGFKLLEYVDNRNFWVVFVTAHSHYALQAIKTAALDYIMKPVGIKELRDTVEKIQSVEKGMSIVGKKQSRIDLLRDNMRIADPSKRKIALRTHNGYELIEVSQIIRCEAERAYCVFHLKDNRKIVVSKSLKSFVDTLEQMNFMRIHRSHLVNMMHVIRYIQGDNMRVLMSDQNTVPVAHRQRHRLLQYLSAAKAG
ncbi:MAG: LytTR family DNA-binding domain-containing protein, partial [Flavobacteriales bacterium]|nr:LytTR family DNA-binding domain-containing protein [Flavobacteriales bacterium]